MKHLSVVSGMERSGFRPVGNLLCFGNGAERISSRRELIVELNGIATMNLSF
jgi:hypothetical protein